MDYPIEYKGFRITVRQNPHSRKWEWTVRYIQRFEGQIFDSGPAVYDTEENCL